MFLFSWEKIYKNSKGSVANVFIIFKMLVKDQIPHNKYDPIYKFYDKDYSGQSFLANAEKLLEMSFKYKTKEVVEYIALASFRSYSEYIMHGVTTLNLINSPLPLDKIKQNRLLRVEGNTIYFLFEEAN
jgi:hypothetical protein